MKSVLMLLSMTVAIFFSHGQSEVKSFEDLKNEDLKSFVKDKHPAVYLLDGEISLPKEKEITKIYTDVRSIHMIDQLAITFSDQAIIIIRANDITSSKQEIADILNKNKNIFKLVHFIFENECASSECFNQSEKMMIRELIEEKSLQISYEYEIIQ